MPSSDQITFFMDYLPDLLHELVENVATLFYHGIENLDFGTVELVTLRVIRFLGVNILYKLVCPSLSHGCNFLWGLRLNSIACKETFYEPYNVFDSPFTSTALTLLSSSCILMSHSFLICLLSE